MDRRILIVDDEREMRALLQDELGARGFSIATAGSYGEAAAWLSTQLCDVVVCDVRMRDRSGLELCEWLRANRPEVLVLLITGFGSLETAVEAIRAGAHDFLAKPFDVEELVFRIEQALRHRGLVEEVKRLRTSSDERLDGDLVGESPLMRALRKVVSRVAEADAPVLVTGETGTGKELVARAIHRHGPRRSGPFVAINCAALPEALLESELFGHVKGAFTDAHEPRTGLFLQASGGTLFLDEIGELSATLQPKLLRALQDRRVRPVGGAKELRFDARVIAATNRDLAAAVEAGRFREDLLYRLDVLRVEVPPLRMRGGDVLLLAERFARDIARRTGRPVLGLSRSAAESLCDYAWPGNVRELQNAIERASALADHDHILLDDLPERIRTHRNEEVLLAGSDPATLVPLEEIERRYARQVLAAAAGNKTLAARILGVDRKTLYRILRTSAEPDEA